MKPRLALQGNLTEGFASEKEIHYYNDDNGLSLLNVTTDTKTQKTLNSNGFGLRMGRR